MKEHDTRYKSRHVLTDEEYHNMLYRGITIEEYWHQAQEARLKEIGRGKCENRRV